MNQHSDTDRLLRHWMSDGPSTMPDRVVDVVADRISRQPQRRTWRLLGRPFVNTYLKLAAGLAAVAIVAVVGYNLLPGRQPFGGPGGSPSAGPTSTPTSTPAATGPVALPDATLVGGTYRIDLSVIDPSLSVVADIPAGWTGFPEAPAVTSPGAGDMGVVIGFMKVDGLYSDPCHWDLDGTKSTDQVGDVVVGPTVADLVAALKANTSYTSSTSSPVTFGQFAGQELELQLPGEDGIRICDNRPGESSGDYFVAPGGFYAQGPDNRWQLSIVDVSGTRVIILLSYFAATPLADLEDGRAIVDSFEFTP